MAVADATRHGAHVLAINQHRHSQRVDDLLDESSNQMGRSLLVLQSSREMSRDT